MKQLKTLFFENWSVEDAIAELMQPQYGHHKHIYTNIPALLRKADAPVHFSEIGLTSDISEERLRAADAIISRKQAPKTVQFPRGYRLTVAKGQVCFEQGGTRL